MGSLQERFMSKFEPVTESGCWLWTGARAGLGYGRFKLNGEHVYAHRLSFELFKGPIPEGMFVCHHCDVACCVNPNHLFVGTASDNTRDCVKKGRFNAPYSRVLKTHCKRGHELTKENIYTSKSNPTGRCCRICMKELHAKWYRDQK